MKVPTAQRPGADRACIGALVGGPAARVVPAHEERMMARRSERLLAH